MSKSSLNVKGNTTRRAVASSILELREKGMYLKLYISMLRYVLHPLVMSHVAFNTSPFVCCMSYYQNSYCPSSPWYFGVILVFVVQTLSQLELKNSLRKCQDHVEICRRYIQFFESDKAWFLSYRHDLLRGGRMKPLLLKHVASGQGPQTWRIHTLSLLRPSFSQARGK